MLASVTGWYPNNLTFRCPYEINKATQSYTWKLPIEELILLQKLAFF